MYMITAISAMSLPEDERNRDPCYVNWKNEEKNKYDKILRDRETLEKQILENSRPKPYDNSQKSYIEQEETRQRNEDDRDRDTKPKPKQESSNSKYIVVSCIIGFNVSILVICGCYGVYKRGKQPGNAPMRTQGPTRVTTAELNPLMSPDALRQQPHPSPRPPTVTRRPGPNMPESQNTPPIVNIKNPVYGTDDNPPSYAKAISMPSAPPREESPENSTI